MAARRTRNWLVMAAVVDVCLSLEPFCEATAVRVLGIPETTAATRITGWRYQKIATSCINNPNNYSVVP